MATYKNTQTGETLSEEQFKKRFGQTPPVSQEKTPAAAPAPKKDLLQQSSDVLGAIFPGTKQIGASLGNAAVGLSQLPKGGIKGVNDYFKDNQTNVPALAGAYVASGSQLAGTAGVGTTGGLLKKAIQSAALSAGVGGGSAAAEGGDLGTVAKEAVRGAVIGAGTSAAFSGAEYFLGAVSKMPQRLIRSATGQSKAQLMAGKDISDYVLKNKKIGTAEQLINDSQITIDKVDKIINQNLASAPEKAIPVRDIMGDIVQSINQSGGEIDDAGVRKIIEGMAPQVKRKLEQDTLTLVEANKLRSQLDKILGERAFINAQLPYNKGILMDFTHALREQVKNNAPEGTRAAFNTYSNEVRLRNLLMNKEAGKSRNALIGFGDLVSLGVGGSIGGIPGALMTAGVKHAAESTLTKTGAAVLIDRLDQTLSPILEGLEPTLQTQIINALTQAFSESPKESQPKL